MTSAVESPEIARLIAFYLPQFHPIPENDAWWGAGFTEWTNVTRARSWFKGHQQPHLPADLGFCDLRVPETRAAQADMARAYGIHGFCYYHYWFAGRRLLQRPFDEVLGTGEPDFPFCLCWANGHFTRAWDGKDSEMLLEQTYSSDDDLAHIRALLPAFEDRRYIRVNGRPLFLFYNAAALPDAKATTNQWRGEAQAKLGTDLYLVRVESYHEPQASDPRPLGFDAAVAFHPSGEVGASPMYKTRRYSPLHSLGLIHKSFRHSSIFDYATYARAATHSTVADYPRWPCVMPGWDNSARRQRGATIFLRNSPVEYGAWLSESIRLARQAGGEALPAEEVPLVFINAWNEWGEGAYLEPSQRSGRAYLEATKLALVNAAMHAEA